MLRASEKRVARRPATYIDEKRCRQQTTYSSHRQTSIIHKPSTILCFKCLCVNHKHLKCIMCMLHYTIKHLSTVLPDGDRSLTTQPQPFKCFTQFNAIAAPPFYSSTSNVSRSLTPSIRYRTTHSMRAEMNERLLISNELREAQYTR